MVFESFSHPEEWDLVNFRLKNELNTLNQIRSYINPFLAVHDLLISVAQLYAHKRSIAWVTGCSPLLENTQPYFIRESYQVQNIKLADLQQAPDQGQSIIEGLDKNTLFLVFFKNHALTGENFPHEKIEEWAIAKKIFFVLVNHEFTSDFKLQPNSYGIQIPSQDLSLVYLPERAKVYSPVGPYQNIHWKEEWLLKLKGKSKSFEADVKSWESSLTQTKWNYKSQRSWDRSLIVFDGIHGDLVAGKLKEKGFANVRSYSDCVSNSPKSIRSWIQPEISDDVLRGLISLSFRDVKDIPSKAVIDDIVNEIKSDSEWSF
tara:strand:- start:65068 stop:66018 length:951 start_codon:yes stop_codon:yes gene_type:complete